MAKTQPDIVPVTQEDREAAAKIRLGMADYIRKGALDHWLEVQAFARHAVAAHNEGMRRAAEIAKASEYRDGLKIHDAILTETERGERG
jgi:hypothetical protein